MAQVTLQRVLRQDGAAAVLETLIGAMDAQVRLEDPKGTILLGSTSAAIAGESVRLPVLHDGETIGWVAGSPAAAKSLASTVAWVAERAVVSKQLVAEALNCYREINVIHRFAGELATLVDRGSVGQAAIAQALRLVKASFGAVLMADHQAGRFEPIAAHDAPWAKEEIPVSEGLIGTIVSLGNAEVVNDVPTDERNGRWNLKVNSIICAPLKMKEETFGALVVGSTEPATYTAADLKMLSTLAIQTSTAFENTLLYEQKFKAAQAEAEQQMAMHVEEQRRKAAEEVLLNILPETVAKELQLHKRVQPMYFQEATVCFTDFVGFSKSTHTMDSETLVLQLDKYFTAFDRIIQRYGLEKLKTIGDSYMFAGGLPGRKEGNPVNAVLAALEIVETVRQIACGECVVPWQIRVGLHTGPVVAGVVGIHKFAFDIWGDTVNIASRMESCGAPNRVNLSQATSAAVQDFIALEPRGSVKTKEGFELEMYFVAGIQDRLLPPALFNAEFKHRFGEDAPAFPPHLGSFQPALSQREELPVA